MSSYIFLYDGGY